MEVLVASPFILLGLINLWYIYRIMKIRKLYYSDYEHYNLLKKKIAIKSFILSIVVIGVTLIVYEILVHSLK